MKKKMMILLCVLCLALIPRFSAAAQEPAGAGQRAAAMEMYYRAPAYGTKEAAGEKLALYEAIEQTAEALGPVVDALAALTVSHNVQLENYSDADAMGLIYRIQGSGVILAVNGDAVYISVAAHCLKHTHTEVVFPDGSHCKGTVVYKNPAKDVGFVTVDTAALSQETLAALSPAPGMGALEAGKQQGDLLFVVSSSDGPNALAQAGVLDSYSVVYPNNPQQEVLQFYSTVSHGSSGAALYTPEGIWVGSVSGGDNYGTCWAVPYEDILAEFNSWLAVVAMQQAAQIAQAG